MVYNIVLLVNLIFLKSNFYVFAPRVGDHLDVTVLTVGKTSATAEGKKTGLVTAALLQC